MSPTSSPSPTSTGAAGSPSKRPVSAGSMSKLGSAQPTSATRSSRATRWWGASPAPGPISICRWVEVVVESSIRCGACRRCTNGLASCNLRRPVNAYGRLPSTDRRRCALGGLAEYLYLDPAQAPPRQRRHPGGCRPSPTRLPRASPGRWRHRLQPGGERPGDGARPPWALCLIARSAGAGWIGVTGLAHDGDRLDLARSLGADMTATVEHGDIASSVANSLGARPDVVIDVTSSDPEAIYMGLDLVRAGGRVVPRLDQGANTVTQLFSTSWCSRSSPSRRVWGHIGWIPLGDPATGGGRPARPLVSHEFPRRVGPSATAGGSSAARS